MKSALLLLVSLATANAQCTKANFGFRIQDGEPIGDNDVFTDFPLSCEVEDMYLGRTYDCRQLRQVSRNRCLLEAEDMPVTVTMKWEVKNTKNGSARLLPEETWVDFSGPAIAGGSERVTPTLDNDNVWVGGKESRIFTASVTVNKCEPSFDAKFRVKEQAVAEGQPYTCVRVKTTSDLIRRRCDVNVDVECYVSTNSTGGDFLPCDTVMRGIQEAPEEDKATLFIDQFCSSTIEYVYTICNESPTLDFVHKTSGNKQTRAFLKYPDSTSAQLDVSFPDLDPEDCEPFGVIVEPPTNCTEAADPSLFPLGIYDANGRMSGPNIDRIKRKYSNSCWERSVFQFLNLDASIVPPTEVTCAPTPAPTPAEETDMIAFTVPQAFKGKKTTKCKKTPKSTAPNTNGKGGKGTKSPTPSNRRH